MFHAAAYAATPERPLVETFTLANGLEVIVIPNHRVPAVSHMLWYRIGAADDPLGKSGLAHYHEHMMFLGTEHYKAGQYSDIINQHGGQHNAFTGYDATAYYVDIAKEYLPLAMQLEADRMQNLSPDSPRAEKEREVIIEERRMRIDNNPDALLAEQMHAALFRNHPYHWPTIGWKHEMQGLTKDDVLAFHAKYYHPNNAILIVSGDITAAELKPMAEKYYGKFKPAKIPARSWNKEPPQLSARHLTLAHPEVTQAELSRDYQAASINDSEHADQALPLLVLSQLLGGGKTSQLYQSLITKQKLVTDVDTGYSPFALGPSLFSIGLTPAANVSLEQAEQALDQELALFLSQPINAEDLARAKTLLAAEAIFSRDGLAGMARIMGWMRISGKDVHFFEAWPDLIQAVTAEQVKAAALATLKPEASVTGYLIPGKKEAKP